jgi:hypothetical protein
MPKVEEYLIGFISFYWILQELTQCQGSPLTIYNSGLTIEIYR